MAEQIEDRVGYIRDYFLPTKGEERKELPKDGYHERAPKGHRSFYSAQYIAAPPPDEPQTTKTPAGMVVKVTLSRMGPAVILQVVQDMADRGLVEASDFLEKLNGRELEGELLDQARNMATNAQSMGEPGWPLFGWPALIASRKPPALGVFRDRSKFCRPGWEFWYSDVQRKWSRGLA